MALKIKNKDNKPVIPDPRIFDINLYLIKSSLANHNVIHENLKQKLDYYFCSYN